MRFEISASFPFSAQTVVEWHGRPGALQRLLPPWDGSELLREDEAFESGKRFEIGLDRLWGAKEWRRQFREVDPRRGFLDTQVSGPFASWSHRLEAHAVSESACELRETVDCEPPAGKGSDRKWEANTTEWLRRWFAHRHATARADLQFRQDLGNFAPLRVLISGGSGFLGTHLKAFLSAQGHSVCTLTRRPQAPDQIRWDPSHGEIEIRRLERFDAVAHLAGASLTSGRWTNARKKELWSSRVDATRFLTEALGQLEKPPGILLSGSGIGYYGDRADSIVDEASPRGDGFLAELCEAWERAAASAQPFVERIGFLRTGVVLDSRGGALAQMLPPFRMGLGGPIGSGSQWFPWIALEDWIRAVAWCLFRRKAAGPINLVAPEATRQRAFAQALGNALERPALLPAPRFALRALFGEMADEALLSSIRAQPAKLAALGYPFARPRLERALEVGFGRHL